MSENSGTTTVQVDHETWRALDIRKERGESFDDAIRRLIGQTGPDVGDIKTDAALEAETEELDDPPAGATCSHYDLISGETCGDTAAYIQYVSYDDGDAQELYLCDEHGGLEPEELQADE